MFKIPRHQPWPPALDLTTVRDTLAYMKSDMARIPGLERVAAALDDALIEIEVAEGEAKPVLPAKGAKLSANFVAWKPMRYPSGKTDR